MLDKWTIQKCIEAIADRRGDLQARAERSAKQDHYSQAYEDSTLALGIGISIEELEGLKREAK